MRPAVFLAPLLLSACAAATDPAIPDPGPQSSPAALLPRGSVWRFASANGMKSPPDTVATLTRTDQGIAGNSGCNQYFGGATITADRLNFHDINGTLMACLDRNAMRFEGEVSAALNAADGVRGTSGGALTLTARGRPVAELVPHPTR